MASWRGLCVRVVFDVDTPELLDRALTHDQKIWAAQPRRNSRGHTHITTKVLSHSNKV